MVRRLRPLRLALVPALLALALLSACGGDDQAAGQQDVGTLLRQTFTGDKHIRSGKLAVALDVDARGTGQVRGPLKATLSGPFQSNGARKLPSFDLAAKLSGAGQDISAGVTSTGDQGFVSFMGQPYRIDDAVWAQFKQSFESAQRKEPRKQPQSLATLGIDPRKWLTNARYAGTADVGGTETLKITGDVDVARMLQDVNRALARATSLGGPAGAQLPTRLTVRQQKAIRDAVKRLDVEIYTGKDDRILRRLVVDGDLQLPAGAAEGLTGAAVRLDITLTDVNEAQEISAPANAKPFSALTRQLGALGIGGFGMGGGGSSSGSDTASADALEAYAKCIRKAGSDAAKAQKCAELLTP